MTRINANLNHRLRMGGSSTTGSIRVDARSFAGTHPNPFPLCSLRSLRLNEARCAGKIHIVAHLDYSVPFRSSFRGKSPFFSLPLYLCGSIEIGLVPNIRLIFRAPKIRHGP